MKKFSLILTLVLVLSLLCGCAGTTVVYQTNCTCPVGSHDTPATEAAPAVPETIPADQIVSGAVKTGLALVTGIKVEEEKASYDVTFVAVNVDDNGVITACAIDSLGADVPVADVAGTSGDVKTKQELGYDYNMITYGGAKFEWFEQAAGFAAYITGKTPAEVSGIAIDETTKSTDADLTATCTIAIGGFQALIAKAAQ